MVAVCPPRATMASDSPSATISCNPCEVIAPGEVGAGQVVTSVSPCPPEGSIVTDSPYATFQGEECFEIGPAPEPPEEEVYIQDQDVTWEFTVFGGKKQVGAEYGGNCVHPNPGPPTTTITSWEGEFWYSDDGGGTFAAVAGTYNSFASPGDPTPWSYSVAIDPTLFNVAGRRFYIHYKVNGGAWIISYMAFYVDPTPAFTDALFWMYSADYTGVPNGWIYTFWKVWVDYGAVVIDDLYVALFDRQTNQMLTGSELIFTMAELGTFKTAYIIGTDFPFTHEVELRAKSTATDWNYAPGLLEAYIYVDTSNITIFTSFQRVSRGSLTFGWGLGEPPYPLAGQMEYMYDPPSRWWGGVDTSAKAMIHKVPGMEMRYQICADTYADPVWVPPFPYDPLDPGDAYEYEALWDNGISDGGLPPDGYNRVDSSKLFFTTPDFSAWQNRVLKTSGNIVDALTDSNRYCQMNLDDQYYWIMPMNAQILNTVRGTGPMDLPDTFIYFFAGTSAEVYSNGLVHPSDIAVPPTSYKRWDPNKYDGTIQAWFEVTVHNSMQEASAMSLVDSDGTVYATINIPVTEPPIGASTSYCDWYTYRVATTLPAAVTQLGVLFPIAHFNARLYIKDAFVRIRQTGATKSRTFVPMLSFGFDWGVTSNPDPTFLGYEAEVTSGGVYLPNFDDPDYLNGYSYAMDGVPIIKLG